MDKKKGNLQELFDSLKYAYESKKGKYSLDTYLDIIGEFADRTIREYQNDNNSYMGGDCHVSSDPMTDNSLIFQIELYFKGPDGQNIKKEATRQIEASRFTSESVERIKSAQELVFPIEAPTGGN